MEPSHSIPSLKVLQRILSQTLDVICEARGVGREDAFVLTESFIRENSDRWRQDDPNINYNDPFSRMAYLYMNVAAHAALVERALSSFPEPGALLQAKIATGEELRICALGGGPGSELLGLVRYIEGLRITGRVAYLDFALIDRVKEWNESWHALKAGVDTYLRSAYGDDRGRWPVAISRSFLPLDVTSASEFDSFATRFQGVDIFVVCYLVSEVKASAAEFEKVLDLLMQRTTTGALIIFIDRDERQVRELVLQMVQRNEKLALLGLRKERGRLEEDLDDLGEWYIHIPSLPRKRWLAFFCLARKSGEDAR